jgi:hypothetical protein
MVIGLKRGFIMSNSKILQLADSKALFYACCKDFALYQEFIDQYADEDDFNESGFEFLTIAVREALETAKREQSTLVAASGNFENIVFECGGDNPYKGAKHKSLITVTQKQTKTALFTVVYGLQVKTGLTYSQACTELGACILHNACNEGLASNEGSL